MRLTSLFIMASLMQVSATTFGQMISVHRENVPLKTVLKDIRNQSGFDFYYDGKVIPEDKRVSVSVDNATIQRTLQLALNGLNLSYEINGKIISIKPKEVLGHSDHLKVAFAAIEVRGSVLDDKGQPLQGVSILLKGSKTGTVTDASGNYIIRVPEGSGTLVFSFVGFNTKEVNINNSKTINVTLTSATSGLNEVVVVGYGSQKKDTVTG